jgi:hypothetical protein
MVTKKEAVVGIPKPVDVGQWLSVSGFKITKLNDRGAIRM